MSLPIPAPREKLHRREIIVEGFKREDGNYDIDATLCDTKTYEFTTGHGVLEANTPLHGLGARMTITPHMEIVDFAVAMDETPSPACDTAGPNFKALIGLKISGGFLRAANERVGGTLGCTHVREMLPQMATVAFQTTYDTRTKHTSQTTPPRLMNTCHGWREDGVIIRNNFPNFYHPTKEERRDEGE